MITLEKILDCDLSGDKLRNYCKLHNTDYKDVYVDPDKNFVIITTHLKICIINPKYNVLVLDKVRGHFDTYINVNHVVLVTHLKADSIIESSHDQLFIAAIMEKVSNDDIKREADHLLDKYHTYLKENNYGSTI